MRVKNDGTAARGIRRGARGSRELRYAAMRRRNRLCFVPGPIFKALFLRLIGLLIVQLPDYGLSATNAISHFYEYLCGQWYEDIHSRTEFHNSESVSGHNLVTRLDVIDNSASYGAGDLLE